MRRREFIAGLGGAVADRHTAAVKLRSSATAEKILQMAKISRNTFSVLIGVALYIGAQARRELR